MTTIKELKNGNVPDIVTALFAGGLGFYLAITLSDAVKSTVDRFIPDENDADNTLRNWISVGVAIFIVTIAIYCITSYYKSKSN